MAVTVSDLIHSSFRLIGAIAAGEVLETNELDDAFVSLNQLVSSWNTEGLSLAGRARLTMPVFGTNSYLLSQRPIKIDAASVAISGVDSPLDIVDSLGWEAIPEKQATAIYVKKLYCDYLYPQSTVYIAPIPRVQGLLEMWIYAAIQPFLSLAQTIDLPPGYEAALRYVFAVNLAPEYGRPLEPSVPAQAQNFKASLVQLNASNQARSQAQAPALQGAQ